MHIPTLALDKGNLLFYLLGEAGENIGISASETNTIEVIGGIVRLLISSLIGIYCQQATDCPHMRGTQLGLVGGDFGSDSHAFPFVTCV